ncbi:hypothetical protein [Pseudorhodoplanes sp.]|uniref:hypothetical protein n=1 Tax=Pseudorhodoplanes sp. TaxID=1934341 RepID=UPI002BAF249F|nr:hypothetical protein [Pseudorhodoplanes sp.]HWV51160.1 hypothetical protein [Pseudorhodoplanes sp.]
MQRDKRVLLSVNNEDASHCVDIFVRAEGTFGFEEYRRDVEDNAGWFTTGGYAAQTFADEASAIEAAKLTIPWLTGMLPG